MDLEAIWQTHKTFIIKVGGGALVFLIAVFGRSSIADSSAQLSRSNANKESAFQDKRAQLEGAEGREKGRAKTLAETLEPALVQALMWQPASGYALPEGEKSPVLFYATALSKALSEIGRAADKVNAKCPRKAGQLGLPEEVEDPSVPEALAKVELVRGVLTRLIEAGVREVSFLEPGDARYTERRGDGRFLRTLPIKFAFVGSTQLLAQVLDRFQQEGSFLEVVSCRMAPESTKPGAKLVVDMELQALEIVNSMPSGGKTSQRPAVGTGGTSSGPRSFGRDR